MRPANPSRSDSGFTLVELTIVVVISTIALIAIYQSLITQERTYRYQSAAIDAQGTSRMALQVVASELREISASAGLDPNMGGTDLLIATDDSIRFRAFRKVGIVCSVADSANGTLDVWVPGDPFIRGDQIMVFQPGNTTIAGDDAWTTATVGGVRAGLDASCESNWNQYPVQNLQGVGAAVLGTAQPGTMVRSFVTATYGSYPYNDYWVVGRSIDGTFEPLVGPVLPADSGGLDFRYFDSADNALTPITDAQRSTVARVMITVRSVSRRGGMEHEDWIDSVTTNVFLRGN